MESWRAGEKPRPAQQPHTHSSQGLASCTQSPTHGLPKVLQKYVKRSVISRLSKWEGSKALACQDGARPSFLRLGPHTRQLLLGCSQQALRHAGRGRQLRGRGRLTRCCSGRLQPARTVHGFGCRRLQAAQCALSLR